MKRDEALQIIEATPKTIGEYGLCGYQNPDNLAYQTKLAWLKPRFKQGMKLQVLVSDQDGTIGAIEYTPGEVAWRAVRASGYMFIHCLFILRKAYKGSGCGSRLIAACEKDARAQKMRGVAVVASKSTWMTKKEVFLKRGYDLIEQAPPHYELLAKSFGKPAKPPAFSGNWEKKLAKYRTGLTIIYSEQCPYVAKAMNEIPPVAQEQFGIEPTIVKLSSYRAAQACPNPYGTFSVIYDGQLVADHPIGKTRFGNIMRQLGK